MASILIFILSFISLIWSAQHLITGAQGLSLYYRIPPLIAGLTLVALGSSAPEIMVAISAGILGHSDLAISNAVGTNLANIGLVLGATALLHPHQPKSAILQKEYPILFVVMLFMYLLVIDGELGAIDGLLLIVGFIMLLSYLFFNASLSRAPHFPILKAPSFPKHFLIKNAANVLIGLIVIAISAKFFIKSTVEIAYHCGMSEAMISTTVLAIATGAPELITSLVAAFRGKNDIAVGNILGSNLFNLLTLLACPSILHPSPISYSLLWRDIPTMLFITALLFAINRKRPSSMNRWHGSLLILIYLCYMTALVLNAVI